MFTLQVVRHSSISNLLPLGTVSLLSQWFVCLHLFGKFHVQKVRFISICSSPRNRRMYLKAVFQRMDSHNFIPSCFSNQILKRKTELLIQWNACFYETDLCHSKWPKDTITWGIYGCISSAGNICPYKLNKKEFYQRNRLLVCFNIAAHTSIALYFLGCLHKAWKERRYCFTSPKVLLLH